MPWHSVRWPPRCLFGRTTSFGRNSMSRSRCRCAESLRRFEWNNPHALLVCRCEGRKRRHRQLGGGVGQPAGSAQGRLDQGRAEGGRCGDHRGMAGARRQQAGERQNRRAGKRQAVGGSVRKRKPQRHADRPKPTPRWPDGHPRLGVVPGRRATGRTRARPAWWTPRPATSAWTKTGFWRT